MNIFKQPMTIQEQEELSDLLDDFYLMYENGFCDQVNDEDDRDELLHEFKGLYDMVWMLEDRELKQEE
jgi:hypothetical protein